MRYLSCISLWIIAGFLHSASLDFVGDISPAPNQLNPNGTLIESAVPALLAKAFADKKLSSKDFSGASCMTAKSLNIAGSFNTVQLIVLKSTCASSKPVSYVIKEARQGEREALALREVELFPALKSLLLPNVPSANQLNLALPIGYLSYTGGSYGAKHYLAIMPFAKGRALCDVVKEYRDFKNTVAEKEMAKIYFNLGVQLANFHQKIKKPSEYSSITSGASHGDLHCLNVFYDTTTQRATLIDNETIASTLKTPGTPDDDLLKLFLGAFSTSPYEPKERKDYIDGVNLTKWFDIAFASFVDGYASAYPQASRKQVYADLKKIFNNIKMPEWFILDSRQLKELREKYINKVLDKKINSQ